MNWGTKIAILYLAFAGLIIALAITCFGQKVELESADYYAKELKFEDQLDAMRNVNGLSGPVMHQVKGHSVELIFPKEVLNGFKGSALFFRPSDASMDRTIVLSPDGEGRQVLSDKGLRKGLYKMRVSFSSQGRNFYQEEVINFQ